MPFAMRIAGAWAWRILVIIAAAVPILWLMGQASLLVIPLAVALLFAALLEPFYNRLRHWKWPKPLALLTTLLVFIAAITLLFYLVISQVINGMNIDPAVVEQGWNRILTWLRESPLNITDERLNAAFESVVAWVEANVSSILTNAVAVGSSIVSFFTASFVVLFALIFFLLDGRLIWLFFVQLLPKPARAAADGAARRGWISVGHYVRVQVLVALIDAVGITVGALFLQVPFAIPIGIIVFLASFIPLVGAVVSGALAVIVALIYNDFWNALAMLGVVLVVMQVESNVLQPIIMGNAVKIHPLAVLASVTAGSIFGGIIGAIFAVPLVAAVNVAVQYIASGEWRDKPDPTDIDPDAPDFTPTDDDEATSEQLQKSTQERIERSRKEKKDDEKDESSDESGVEHKSDLDRDESKLAKPASGSSRTATSPNDR